MKLIRTSTKLLDHYNLLVGLFISSARVDKQSGIMKLLSLKIVEIMITSSRVLRLVFL